MYLAKLAAMIKKNLIFILTVVVLGALIAYISSSFVQSGYRQERTMFLKVEERPGGPQGRIDRQALTDTVAALIASTDFQRGISTSGVSAAARKQAPQVITITTTSQRPELSRQALENIVSKFNSTSATLITDSDVELVSLGELSEPEMKILSPKLLAIFGALVGLTVALAIILIYQFFKL